jgi:predicted nucleotidyltransferase
MRRLPQLVEITPEGKIVAALIRGPKSYGGLKSTTGLSDRWLSKKLEELSSSGIVEHEGSNYQLKNTTEIINADPIFAKYLQEKISLKVKARLIAEEISHNEQVVAVILFGSVAKEQATEESDIDLLVVTEVEMEDQLNNIIYNLMFKHNVPVEAVFLTYDDLIINLQAKTAFSLGLLEGYQILHDRGGVENLLSIKEKEMRENWVYNEEAQTWIQKKLLPTLKPQKTN